MRKEIILAIVVGIIVGLAITFGIYTVRQQLSRNQTPAAIEESRLGTPGTVPTATPTTTLNIQQPEQDFLTSQSTVQIVGRAIPDSYIVILTEGDEYITTADQDGDFAQEITLQPGGNRITTIATTPNGEQESVVNNVVYSTVDLNTQNATASSETEDTETENE